MGNIQTEVRQESFRSVRFRMEASPVQKHSMPQPQKPHNKKFLTKHFIIVIVLAESIFLCGITYILTCKVSYIMDVIRTEMR